jgi:hypothetical protein
LPADHISPRLRDFLAFIASLFVLFSFAFPILNGANLQNDAITHRDFQEYERKVLKATEEDAGNARGATKTSDGAGVS